MPRLSIGTVDADESENLERLLPSADVELSERIGGFHCESGKKAAPKRLSNLSLFALHPSVSGGSGRHTTLEPKLGFKKSPQKKIRAAVQV